VGLAFGFGGQLIRDIIGLFIILENQYIGDVVK
jgi:hypothetical protein